MLSRLRDYLQQRRVAPLSDIALHLGVAPDVARAMLERWQRKGRIERVDTGRVCGSCDRCAVGALEVYRWCDGAGDGEPPCPGANAGCH
jgi:hypothetical protein